MTSANTSSKLPPFPEDVHAHPLLVIDYAKLKDGTKYEEDALWKACTELGFFYLKNHNVGTQGMWEMGQETMALPLEEKMKFEQGDAGNSLGYKAVGANNTDESGNRDTTEFMNVSKDDALSRPQVAHRTYPSTVEDRMATIRTFIENSEEVTRTLMDILSDRLGLPRELLRERHHPSKYSPSESRVIKSPPKPGMTPEQAALGAHTDFGSLVLVKSFLHNILGGLQVLVPGSETWQYVKPLPGHAICNIGDSLTIYSGGILRSNMHRVVLPPGDQKNFVRWSLVYFLRPTSSAILEPLTQSPLIAAATQGNDNKFSDHVTAEEWFTRRVKLQRVVNRTGPETWRASRGTEHKPTVA